MRFNSILVVLMIFLVAGCATNSKRLAGPEDPFAMPIEEFLQETERLRAGLADGEFREIEDEALSRFDEIDEKITALIGDATELEQIAMYDRQRLYELRTEMVNLVVGEREPTLVCFNQHSTGTRLRGSRRCYTLAELERNRFDARQLMQYIENHPRGQHPDGMDPFEPLVQ